MASRGVTTAPTDGWLGPPRKACVRMWEERVWWALLMASRGVTTAPTEGWVGSCVDGTSTLLNMEGGPLRVRPWWSRMRSAEAYWLVLRSPFWRLFTNPWFGMFARLNIHTESPRPFGMAARSVLVGCCTLTQNSRGLAGLKIMPVASEPWTRMLMKWSTDSATPSLFLSRKNQMSPPVEEPFG